MRSIFRNTSLSSLQGDSLAASSAAHIRVETGAAACGNAALPQVAEHRTVTVDGEQVALADVAGNERQTAAGHDSAVGKQRQQGGAGSAAVDELFVARQELQGASAEHLAPTVQPRRRLAKLLEFLCRQRQMFAVLAGRDHHAVKPEPVCSKALAELGERL